MTNKSGLQLDRLQNQNDNIMKLAEQIKDNLRKDFGMVFTALSKEVEEIFTKHPTDTICINPSYKFNVSEKDYRGMWSIDIPEEWSVDVMDWAISNGFKITEHRGQNGQLFHFYINLI